MEFKIWLESYVWEDELNDAGGKIEPDGTVLVYHATTQNKAKMILDEGILRNPANTPDSYGVYFAAGKEAVEYAKSSYGDGTVLPMKVLAKDLKIDDVAPGRWVAFYAYTKNGIYRPVWIGNPL